jgi:putative phosphoesterase
LKVVAAKDLFPIFFSFQPEYDTILSLRIMMIKLGVISDTHIPDRACRLNLHVIPTFQDAGVAAILHAGDVSIPRVLRQLEQVAPVYATRGNRDWVLLRHLPSAIQLNFYGVTIGLTHGHGQLRDYLIDRVKYLLGGYRLEMFEPRLMATFPEARVIIFGHTHRRLNQWSNGKLLFNPGSSQIPEVNENTRSLGLLTIHHTGEVEGEIVTLE